MPPSTTTETAEDAAQTEETTVVFSVPQETSANAETDVPEFEGYNHVKGHFYAKPPKLRQEYALITVQKCFAEADFAAAMDGVIAASLQLLALEESGTLRSVTQEDIEDEFGSEELMSLLSGAFPLRSAA